MDADTQIIGPPKIIDKRHETYDGYHYIKFTTMLYHRIIHTTRPLQSIVQQFNKQIINVRVRSLSSTSNNNNNTNNKKNNESLVKTKIEECGTIAQMILNRPPVNSLSLEM